MRILLRSPRTTCGASRDPQKVADPIPSRRCGVAEAQRVELMKKRSTLRVGMPRVLNMYLYAPLFSAYLESLGVEPENLVYSEFTGQEMYAPAPAVGPSIRASRRRSACRTSTT